uniref:Secreted protein n=1 Tax=Rhodosorus marinus TaxID=101924 RepID=A0A7S0FYQ3_9RHOD|mmetsp:Transcript_11626/g.16816  ORF Transcript_11626/g.16816 Transcript_11626/m.16816 type:complete len:201 (+) Transcript_11626:160-762(+)|eukprot:CAMPEP_0184744798 /NCGR_PEP_ID=MMETSP0315-20130426/7506_1 /TAXON_ID=101924 /ORGANISM="Rhodosorus marinus, Strain UTEX LB 2760" /LENGTH=200 /DNA_ID=CAMNT_0027216645 /DNA_START=173 /DNA_END=775 /DNA_ORIENTATION=+
MNSLVLYCCAVVLLCVVSVEAQTCEDVAKSTGSIIFDVEPTVGKLAVDGSNASAGSVVLSRAKGIGGPEACVRMKFQLDEDLSLVSIRGGIFSKKELIPEPVEYPNRRNVDKVIEKKGLPLGTSFTKLSLVICDDEILTDEAGCCDGSPLFWIAHAIIRDADGEQFRAELSVGNTDECETRVADGPDITVCEVAVTCVEE